MEAWVLDVYRDVEIGWRMEVLILERHGFESRTELMKGIAVLDNEGQQTR